MNRFSLALKKKPKVLNKTERAIEYCRLDHLIYSKQKELDIITRTRVDVFLGNIDDTADNKIYDHGLKDVPGLELTIAYTIEDGIRGLEIESRYDALYLDYYFDNCMGTGTDVLMWLADHPDKIPNEIYSVSNMPPTKFIQMIHAMVSQQKGLKNA